MRHRSDSRYPVIAVGDGAGGGVAASDIRGARAKNGRIVALGAAGAELKDRAVLRRTADTVGFCRDKRLMIDGQQHHSLDELRLDHRAAHDDYRLVREHRRALLDRPYVALEFEICEIFEEFFAKLVLASQIFDVFFCEAEIVQIFYELLKPGKQRKPAVVRDGAEKHIEHGDLVSDVMLKIAVRHRQLIKVGEHRQISGGNFVFDKLCGIHMHKPSLSVLPCANFIFYYTIYKTQFQYRRRR